MFALIDVEAPVFTLINTFSVTPARREEVIASLRRFTGSAAPGRLCKRLGEIVYQQLDALGPQRAGRHDEVQPQRLHRPVRHGDFKQAIEQFAPDKELPLQRQALAGEQQRLPATPARRYGDHHLCP